MKNINCTPSSEVISCHVKVLLTFTCHMWLRCVSRWFLRPQHLDPGDAVLVHKDVQALQSVAIHWGTFNLTFEVCAHFSTRSSPVSFIPPETKFANGPT